jgi:hypothetical protein
LKRDAFKTEVAKAPQEIDQLPIDIGSRWHWERDALLIAATVRPRPVEGEYGIYRDTMSSLSTYYLKTIPNLHSLSELVGNSRN